MSGSTLRGRGNPSNLPTHPCLLYPLTTPTPNCTSQSLYLPWKWLFFLRTRLPLLAHPCFPPPASSSSCTSCCSPADIPPCSKQDHSSSSASHKGYPAQIRLLGVLSKKPSAQSNGLTNKNLLSLLILLQSLLFYYFISPSFAVFGRCFYWGKITHLYYHNFVRKGV